MMDANQRHASELARIQLFSDLRENPEALSAWASIMVERTYAAGTTIIAEGSVGSELYMLIAGKISVFRTPPEGEAFRVAVLSAEQHPTFGESGLIESEPRSATILADAESRCLVLDRAAFDDFSLKYPQWALPVLKRIAQAVNARVKKTNDDLVLLYKALVSEIRGTYNSG